MPPSWPLSPGPDPATVAWCKVQGYASSLFEALDEAGGSAKAAAVGGWSVQALDRALGTLQATREGLDAEIARLPRRRRIG